MMAKYVVVMRDDNYMLVGPFDTLDQFCDWDAWNMDHGDDPRWQPIELKDPHAAPVVFTIEEAKNVLGEGY